MEYPEWSMWENGDGEVGIEDEDGNSIATMENHPEKESNLALMLQAPRLLESLLKVIREVEFNQGWKPEQMETVDEAYKTIAEAGLGPQER